MTSNADYISIDILILYNTLTSHQPQIICFVDLHLGLLNHNHHLSSTSQAICNPKHFFLIRRSKCLYEDIM